MKVKGHSGSELSGTLQNLRTTWNSLIFLLLFSGPTDLSMKSLSSANMNNSSSTSTNHSLVGRGNGGAGGGGASTQLSQPEITAVRQLIAGYRESAAFLLRSADELENLILQQN